MSLDHTLIEMLADVCSGMKLNGLDEKYLLKEAMRGLIPDNICNREKKAYTAPALKSFFAPKPEYVDTILSKRVIKEAGYFDPVKVIELVKTCERDWSPGFNFYSAFVTILSVQLLHDLFIKCDVGPSDVHPIDYYIVDKSNGAEMLPGS